MSSRRCMFCGQFANSEHDCKNRLFDIGPEDELHDLELAASKHQRAERVSRDLWRVNASTDGEYYAIQRDGNRLYCSCKGYAVRRHCSHSTLVKYTAMRLRIPHAQRTNSLILTTNWAGVQDLTIKFPEAS